MLHHVTQKDRIEAYSELIQVRVTPTLLSNCQETASKLDTTLQVAVRAILHKGLQPQLWATSDDDQTNIFRASEDLQKNLDFYKSQVEKLNAIVGEQVSDRYTQSIILQAFASTIVQHLPGLPEEQFDTIGATFLKNLEQDAQTATA